MNNVTYARRKSFTPLPRRGKSLNYHWEEVVTQDIASLTWVQIVRILPSIDSGTFYQKPTSDSEEKPKVNFCSGSNYEGDWDAVGMSGFGKYVFPHGVIYEGQFRDGMFHGMGNLIYPAGQSIEGIWQNGNMISYRSKFTDGLMHSDPWDYCQMPDRKFFLSIQEGLKPAGEEFLTQLQPTRDIPENCYDLNDSFYDSKNECVLNEKFEDSTVDRIPCEWIDISKITLTNIITGKNMLSSSRIPDQQEKDWITAHYRKAWDENVGHRPDLYECWISGRMSEMANIEQLYCNDSYIDSGEDTLEKVIPEDGFCYNDNNNNNNCRNQ